MAPSEDHEFKQISFWSVLENSNVNFSFLTQWLLRRFVFSLYNHMFRYHGPTWPLEGHNFQHTWFCTMWEFCHVNLILSGLVVLEKIFILPSLDRTYYGTVMSFGQSVRGFLLIISFLCHISSWNLLCSLFVNICAVVKFHTILTSC
jgi:hypothetical protein